MSADLEELEVFLAVSEIGSAQSAARQLGISRSKVRRRLQALEQRVGVVLLWSDARGVHPTPAGRLLLEEGPELLRTHRALLADARSVACSG